MRLCQLSTPTLIALCAVGILSTNSVARAQESARQLFTVRVPAKLRVSAPTPVVTATLADPDQDQALATQRWRVESNSLFGATMSFSTDRAFTHTAKPEFRRDGRLDLVIAPSQSPAQWIVTAASDQTCYQGSVRDQQATVRAVSDRPGQGTFDLTVTFLADPERPPESGDYALTIVGTLTAN